MFKAILKNTGSFLVEIFQDVDGGFSSKRTAFFIFIALFITLTLAVYFKAIPKDMLDFAKTSVASTKDLIIWIGGFIASERAGQVVASFKGNKTAEVSPPPK